MVCEICKVFGLPLSSFTAADTKYLYRKIFNLNFQVWLLFSIPRPQFWKKSVEFSNAEFNAE